MRDRIIRSDSTQKKELLALVQQAQRAEEYKEKFASYIALFSDPTTGKPYQVDHTTPLSGLSPTTPLGKLAFGYLPTHKELEVFGTLGKGGYGTVFLALDKQKKRLLCLKIINLAAIPDDLQMEQRIKRQNAIKALFHPAIIRIYDIWQNGAIAVLQLEYFPGRSMEDFWSLAIAWPVEEKLLFVKQVVEGVNCLHSTHEIIHRDLHAANILVDMLGDCACRIIDFDFCKEIFGSPAKDSVVTGHPDNIPPIPDGYKGDIYALGVFAYKLLSNTCTAAQEYDYARIAPPALLPQLPLPNSARAINDILLSSLENQPPLRPTARELCQPFRVWEKEFARQQLHAKSLDCRALLGTHMDYLAGIGTAGKISVDTDGGEAAVYFANGTLSEVEYGKIRGAEALSELADELTLLRHVDFPKGAVAPATASLNRSQDQFRQFWVNQQTQNDERRRKYLEPLQEYMKIFLAIGGAQVLCRNGCGKKFSLESLVYGVNVFLYGKNRYSLAPYCQECIKKIAGKPSGLPLPDPYQSYATAYLYDNVCTQFYLGFRGGDVRMFLVYHKPQDVKPEIWEDILKRLKRGYHILGNYPSRHFTHFRQYLFSLPVDCKSELPDLSKLIAQQALQSDRLNRLFAQNGHPLATKSGPPLPSVGSLVERTHEKDGWKISGEIWRSKYLVFEEDDKLQVYSEYFQPVKSNDAKFVVLAMEYFPGICLRQFLNAVSAQSIDTAILVYILAEVAKALAILHGLKDGVVIHRNVNPDSILVGVNGQVKLGDFSLAKYDPNCPAAEDYYAITMKTLNNPNMVPGYQCPADLRDTLANDIWCWGAVAYELFTGKTWQAGADMSGIPQNIRDLVERALADDKALASKNVARPNAQELVAVLSAKLA
jgi:serine/threonine protein kinase